MKSDLVTRANIARKHQSKQVPTKPAKAKAKVTEDKPKPNVWKHAREVKRKGMSTAIVGGRQAVAEAALVLSGRIDPTKRKRAAANAKSSKPTSKKSADANVWRLARERRRKLREQA